MFNAVSFFIPFLFFSAVSSRWLHRMYKSRSNCCTRPWYRWLSSTRISLRQATASTGTDIPCKRGCFVRSRIDCHRLARESPWWRTSRTSTIIWTMVPSGSISHGGTPSGLSRGTNSTSKVSYGGGGNQCSVIKLMTRNKLQGARWQDGSKNEFGLGMAAATGWQRLMVVINSKLLGIYAEIFITVQDV